MPWEGVAQIMKYKAVFERDPDGRWTVDVPEVKGCHTYGRTIDQARERLREALKLFVDDADTAEIVDDVRLPLELRRQVTAAKMLREKVMREEQSMVTAQLRAVRALRKLNLGHRDAGRILGLSHQRVQQLEKRSGMVQGSVVQQAMRGHTASRTATKKR